MKSKNLSIIVLISILLVNIFGCQNFVIKKTIFHDTPYYSVTIGSYEKSSNHYMNVDIEIPKITYSNQSGSALIDPLNTEIETSLNQLIDEAKNNALTTYNTYIESAKTNAKNEVKNKITKLKNKYKDILGKEELQLLSDFNIDDLEKMPFSNSFRSTNSNTFKRPFMPKATHNDVDRNVNGFTNTEDIIIPGLHNKNIIIVETTTKEITETTIEIEGKPGKIIPSEGEQGFNRPNKDSSSLKDNIEIKVDKQKKSNTNMIATKANANKIIATVSGINIENNIDDDITIENFYRELGSIYRTRIPNDTTLSKEFIPTTIHCGFEIKCLDEDYISLFVQLSESGNTNSIKRLFYNIDLNKGKIINLKDALGENFKENVIKIINSEMDKWSDEQKATLINNYNVENYINENTPFFINNNHKAVVEIEKFAITIGAVGYHEFQIPWIR